MYIFRLQWDLNILFLTPFLQLTCLFLFRDRFYKIVKLNYYFVTRMFAIQYIKKFTIFFNLQGGQNVRVVRFFFQNVSIDDQNSLIIFVIFPRSVHLSRPSLKFQCSRPTLEYGVTDPLRIQCGRPSLELRIWFCRPS